MSQILKISNLRTILTVSVKYNPLKQCHNIWSLTRFDCCIKQHQALYAGGSYPKQCIQSNLGNKQFSKRSTQESKGGPYKDLINTIDKYQRTKGRKTYQSVSVESKSNDVTSKGVTQRGLTEETWGKQLDSFKIQMSQMKPETDTLPTIEKQVMCENESETIKEVYKDPDKLSKVKLSIPVSQKQKSALELIENLKTKINAEKKKRKKKVLKGKQSLSKLKLPNRPLYIDHIEQITEAGSVNAETEMLDELQNVLQEEKVTPDVRQILGTYVAKLKDQTKDEMQELEGSKDTNLLTYLTESLKETGVEITGDIQSYLEIISDQIKAGTIDQDLFQNLKLSQAIDHVDDVKELRKLISETIWMVFGSGLKKMAIEKALEVKTKKPEKVYNQELNSYVEVCLISGMTKAAHAMVTSAYLSHKNKNVKRRNVKLYKITDISIYNKLMWAWAKEGDISRIRKLFSQLEVYDLKPNLETYAACLACLGKHKTFHPQMVDRLLKDIEQQGLDLLDLQLEHTYSAATWHFIEKAVRSVRPDYEFLPNSRESDYHCELLKGLNTSFTQENPYRGVVTSEELCSRVDRQMNMEVQDSVTIHSIQPPVSLTPAVKFARDKIESCKTDWKQSLYQAYSRNLKVLEKQLLGDHRLSILPYLKLFPVDTYVAVMMQELDHLIQDMPYFSQELSLLQLHLGYKIYNKYLIKEKQRTGHWTKASSFYKDFVDDFNKPSLSKNHREMWCDIVNKHDCDDFLTDKTLKWSPHIARKVGTFLYGIILADVKIDPHILRRYESKEKVPAIPAFYALIRTRDKHRVEEVKPHPVLVRLFNEAASHELKMDPLDLPSLVPPVPWCNVSYGADAAGKTDLLKNINKCSEQMEELYSLPESQLYPVLDAINAVSMTPWIINKPVLDILINVFNSGGDPNLDIPKPMSAFPDPPHLTSDMSPEQKVRVFLERSKLQKERGDMYSQWCTELYRMSIANQYRDEVFWFPHNLDFRGRVYACPPHFNHIGSDLARCILKFAKGQPLGPQGLNWLKIHLVNLSGFKKRSSNVDRLTFADDCMDDILDSADNPLNGRQWWKKCDEPWQSLACCMEIAQAVRSPDPQHYICHFPVHQDGSCNGLQHYAALGRDHAGAVSVNLTPFEQPNDVYSDVVELVPRDGHDNANFKLTHYYRSTRSNVEKERQKDAAEGDELARALEGFVRRKVIKQTIMTTVYGVTFYGARQQIRGQLEDLEDFPPEHVVAGANYLTHKTFHCLQQMFTSTKQIQDWLVICAELISNLYQPVQWETPLGLPVVQPYYRYSQVKLPRGKGEGKRQNKVAIEKPNVMKQKNAFPPNFIHSLDATHMMLTAIHCLRAGITFVSVHDCYWTHPCDVEVMNQICREQFVSLHQQPILEDLAAGMLAQYGFNEDDLRNEKEEVVQAKKFINAILQKIPERGSFELEQVLDSTYFFS